jgi:hypothetical protein
LNSELNKELYRDLDLLRNELNNDRSLPYALLDPRVLFYKGADNKEIMVEEKKLPVLSMPGILQILTQIQKHKSEAVIYFKMELARIVLKMVKG